MARPKLQVCWIVKFSTKKASAFLHSCFCISEKKICSEKKHSLHMLWPMWRLLSWLIPWTLYVYLFSSFTDRTNRPVQRTSKTAEWASCFFLNMACQTSYFLEQSFWNINAATKFSRFSMRLLNYKRHKCSTVQLALAQRRDQFSWLGTIFSFLFISWQLLSCFWPKIKADLDSFIVQI